jgi:hypothetical protein
MAHGISMIADRLSDTGLRLSKKERALKQGSGDLTFSVAFRSSVWNRPGLLADLLINVEVSSKQLGEWRRVNVKDPFFHRQPMASRIVYYSIKALGTSKLKWDVLDPITRPMVADDAACTIRTLALPFFDRFQDTQSAVDHLIRRNTGEILWTIEYATAVLGREAGERALGVLLGLFPQMRADYDEALARLLSADGSRVKGGGGRGLAVMAAANGFNPEVVSREAAAIQLLNKQVFFGSFLQKRTFFLPCPTLKPGCVCSPKASTASRVDSSLIPSSPWTGRW